MTDKKESADVVLSGLLLKEEDELSKLKSQVEKAKQIFGIEEKSGKIVFHVSLTHTHKILAFLIGKHFAAQLKKTESGSATITEISKEIMVPATSLSGPTKKLIGRSLLSKKNGKYFIAPYKINEALDRILVRTFGPKGEKMKKESVI